MIPGLTKALYFTGKPSPMGMPGMEVSAVLETTLYITPTGAPQWEAKPTDLETMSLKSARSKTVEV